VSKRDRNGEVVDDVQHRHDQDERHVVPVRHIDVRLLAPRQRAQVDHEIGDPHHDQQDIGVPFRLGISFRLRNAHHVAGDGNQAEQVVAPHYEPRGDLIGDAGARGALHDIERRRDQRIAAEAEDHRGGVNRPDPAETRPGAESQVGLDELPGDPVADGKPKDHPRHREHDADLAGIVVIMREPAGGWRRCVVVLADAKDHENAGKEEQHAVNAERIVSSGNQEQKSADCDCKADQDGVLSFNQGELVDHGPPRQMEASALVSTWATVRRSV
jgi:hypothetical protein